jgi:hypothetical protein
MRLRILARSPRNFSIVSAESAAAFAAMRV